jgi:uncharacterized membrane protein YhaH (DUF805 family)
MDWNWFLFSFDGRITRAQCWFAAFLWSAANFSFMTIFLLVTSCILWATGNDFRIISTSTLPWAFYLLGLPLLAVNVWLVAATAAKRLHDRNKNGWWLLPFFVAPTLLDKFWNWLDNPTVALLVSALSFGLSVWCFVELFCSRGTKGSNQFGPDPFVEFDTRPRWTQHDELQIVPHSAGPPAVTHVKRGNA